MAAKAQAGRQTRNVPTPQAHNRAVPEQKKEGCSPCHVTFSPGHDDLPWVSPEGA
ncbi:NAC domain-containing protein 82 [Clarias magur]|uniref:NAC domain-containing protein 82 n=1 Tax=Clarias magur TaxID=1594786 RepID=A0A8J4UEF8_CLAMG|nr:NAC domain-containing protein 82 [Clarias magur]